MRHSLIIAARCGFATYQIIRKYVTVTIHLTKHLVPLNDSIQNWVLQIYHIDDVKQNILMNMCIFITLMYAAVTYNKE